MKILSRSFSAEILVLQGFPVRLRDSCFFRDKSGYPEIQDNQTFSIAGTRKGFGDPRGTLFFELARLAEARKPPYLLFENVPYVQKCIRYIMYTNQICIVPPKNSGERLFVLCSTVHNMFLLAKG
ncbi:MAG: DNA cytosine methyltransferase [Gemmiger formicilis]|uniref:DNA cytosine methyltransferase n=1 Tax=Gemmiger formicilis TaxID=745368 RepID=UPI00399FE0E0